MWEAPAIIAWTNVNTLRPGRAPPTRPTRRTVESINDSKPEPLGQRRDEQQPGVGDQVRLIEDDLDAVDPMRYSRHWKCLLAWLQRRRRDTVIVPAQEAFLVDTRAASHRANRWIEAKDLSG